MIDFFKRFTKSDKDNVSQDILTERYNAFCDLLRANNNALEIMADLEEKASGEYLFDRAYIISKIELLSSNILKIIESINKLTKNKFSELIERHSAINQELQRIISGEFVIKETDYTIDLSNIFNKDTSNVGGKISHLGEIKNKLGILIPEGFAITAYAFKRFIEDNRIDLKIKEYLSDLNIESLDEINKASQQIQTIILNSNLPAEIYQSIKDSSIRLINKIKAREISINKPIEDIKVSVRSSAILEDSDFSFAGQYATFLNVSTEEIIEKYKAVIASLFTARAVFYYKTKGFSELDMVMAVGVLEMIDARCGGVVYSRDPNDANSDEIIINAVWGLGKAVVDGIYEPHYYRYSRKEGKVVLKKETDQRHMIINVKEGDTREVDVPIEYLQKSCLSDEDIKKLVNIADVLESHYSSPQDIEWVIDKEGRLYILQSRQLNISSLQAETINIPRIVEGYNLLIDKGIIACKGIGFGKVYILKEEDDLKNLPELSVLVARSTSIKFVPLMNKISAIVTDVGSATGHMASISREYNVPTIVNTEIGTKVLQNNLEVTVDAFNCNVYEGKVDILLDLKERLKDSAFQQTYIYKMLNKLLNQIVPLNLVNPEAENFNAKSCKTFHDITRFCHEQSMNAMFDLGLKYGQEASGTTTLRAGVPTEITMIDLGGGFTNNGLKVLTAKNILSIPFKALLKGMISMRWPEPPKTDARGFLGMIARTATISEEQIADAGKRSFAILSKNYINFSIRLGYHFSLIEAFVGENINDNYIRFFFKGGGAAIDRRLRRVGLITAILKKMGFSVKVTNDVINANITDYTEPHLEDRLEIMGKLTAYTKQLDMTLYNDAIAEMFTEQFIKDHMRQYI